MKFYVVLVIYKIVSLKLSGAINVQKLPDDLLIGVASAAYQVEGAWNEDGKGESAWDRFTHTHPEKIDDKSTGDIACDAYHKTNEDVALIKDLGVNTYRFSLSWSRILPNGLPNAINTAGIDYYNTLIDALISNGIEPLVTIFHWDLPQPLQELGGFANPNIVHWITDYAEIVFSKFGDRVKTWITINEPKQICSFGYELGKFSPGISFHGIGGYLCAHNLIKAHAEVYRLYTKQFKATQKGRLGLVTECSWSEPASNSTADIEAAERRRQFDFGIYTHAVYHKNGDYPNVVKRAIAQRSKLEGFPTSRLPTFTSEEIRSIRGTYDFFGLNYYTTYYTKDKKPEPIGSPSEEKDTRVDFFQDENWLDSGHYPFRLVPWGLRKVLNYIKDMYSNPTILITETGFPDDHEYDDLNKIRYFNETLAEVLKAIYYDKVKIQAYTAWSFMDSFEWGSGYTVRFGIYYVNFTDPSRPRSPKASVKFFKNLLKTRTL